MNSARGLVPLMKLSSAVCARAGVPGVRFASGGSVHPGYKKIKEQYVKYQIDDGVPVHLKGGPVDRILYYVTLVGCVVGTGMCFEYYYSASFPKKC